MYTPAFRVSRASKDIQTDNGYDKSGALHKDLIDSGLLRNAPRKAAAGA